MLSVDTASVRYGAIEALNGVSLQVAQGEVVAIIGANGAGKSTLLKGIAGTEPIAGGRVVLEGIDMSRLSCHRRVELGVAMSPEGRSVFADQSVLDNLLLGAFRCRHDREVVAERVEREFLRFPILKQRAQQLAGTLSGGEQQMLAISRALMSDPKLLLLDEPSLGLAPLITRRIFDAVAELRRAGLTLLLVEQMANQALACADRAYVLETGTITIEGTAKELMNNAAVRAAYLGTH